MRRTTRLLPAAALAALALVGCTTPDPTPTPPPTSDATPVFASDEEALVAAEEAYGEYLATVDAILADGGANPERLQPLVAEDVYTNELEGFKSFEKSGWHGVGGTSFSLTVQQYDNSYLSTYVCEDISATDVVDGSGVSVVAPDRADLYAFVVTFRVGEPLVLTSKEPWDGGGVCIS